MQKVLMAASLIASLGGLATSAAHADEFNGTAQRSIEYFHHGRSAAPVFDMMAFDSNVYVMQAPTGTGHDVYDVTSRSHGHP